MPITRLLSDGFQSTESLKISKRTSNSDQKKKREGERKIQTERTNKPKFRCVATVRNLFIYGRTTLGTLENGRTGKKLITFSASDHEIRPRVVSQSLIRNSRNRAIQRSTRLFGRWKITPPKVRHTFPAIKSVPSRLADAFFGVSSAQPINFIHRVDTLRSVLQLFYDPFPGFSRFPRDFPRNRLCVNLLSTLCELFPLPLSHCGLLTTLRRTRRKEEF